MKSFFKKVISWSRHLCDSGGISESDIAENYAGMSDVQFGRINSSELTPEARRLWQAEKERRQRPKQPVNYARSDVDR